jgi:hypothetical protein
MGEIVKSGGRGLKRDERQGEGGTLTFIDGSIVESEIFVK